MSVAATVAFGRFQRFSVSFQHFSASFQMISARIRIISGGQNHSEGPFPRGFRIFGRGVYPLFWRVQNTLVMPLFSRALPRGPTIEARFCPSFQGADYGGYPP